MPARKQGRGTLQQLAENGENQKLIRSLALSEQDRGARSNSGNPEESATTEPYEQCDQLSAQSGQTKSDSKVKQDPSILRQPLPLTVEVEEAPPDDERVVVESPRPRGCKARVLSAGAIRSGPLINHSRPSKQYMFFVNFPPWPVHSSTILIVFHILLVARPERQVIDGSGRPRVIARNKSANHANRMRRENANTSVTDPSLARVYYRSSNPSPTRDMQQATMSPKSSKSPSCSSSSFSAHNNHGPTKGGVGNKGQFSRGALALTRNSRNTKSYGFLERRSRPEENMSPTFELGLSPKFRPPSRQSKAFPQHLDTNAVHSFGGPHRNIVPRSSTSTSKDQANSTMQHIVTTKKDLAAQKRPPSRGKIPWQGKGLSLEIPNPIQCQVTEPDAKHGSKPRTVVGGTGGDVGVTCSSSAAGGSSGAGPSQLNGSRSTDTGIAMQTGMLSNGRSSTTQNRFSQQQIHDPRADGFGVLDDSAPSPFTITVTNSQAERHVALAVSSPPPTRKINSMMPTGAGSPPTSLANPTAMGVSSCPPGIGVERTGKVEIVSSMLQPSHRNGRPFMNGNMNSMESPTHLEMESPSGLFDNDSEGSASSIETEVPESLGWVGGGRASSKSVNAASQSAPVAPCRVEPAKPVFTLHDSQGPGGPMAPSSAECPSKTGIFHWHRSQPTTAALTGIDVQVNDAGRVLDDPVLDIPESQEATDWTMESWDGEQDGGNVDGLLEVASESSSSVVSDEVLLQTNLGDDFLSLFHHH